jgi:UDP-N-acetylglucosamine 2-epimerase (hydrolysing)
VTKRHVVVFTGTRADYPRVRPVLRQLHLRRDVFRITVVVSGQHLLEQFGRTARYVHEDGYGEIHEVPMYSPERKMSDPFEMSLAFSRCASGVANLMERVRPDLALITVDRVETLAFASVLALSNIPIAHIQGGEISGTIDESIRHAVTKLSHVHFPSNEAAYRVLLQLGERPESIYMVGCPYVDEVIKAGNTAVAPLLMKYNLPEEYGIAVYHPVTTEYKEADNRFREFYQALTDSGFHFLVIQPNNDAGSNQASDIPHSLRLHVHHDLYYEEYLTLLANAKVIVGNSSSGIREAPNYGTLCVNVGTRQNGRLRAKSVMDVDDTYLSIKESVCKAFGSADLVRHKSFPFGTGGASEKIVEVLRKCDVGANTLNKRFYYV